ncbi:class I SAM-dependent methyltransferase [Mycolicibacterium sp. P9-64]|uniref:class I SAM-dependent methyltransferase n=1 Tax=Mycolicibacterium sp. P9-64 TaxID=2024612 RepID=UPI0011EF5EC1|nr:class I SAM-dependent methyltransferase [Mycolicibacterium sp. P9-64]KAA0079812.1 class I SAM-dependent methyltransferase [Mycolicibacterium sp. P9-64]
MTIDTMDWDGAYREDGFFEGPPPWNIGEPQPVIADLIRSGAFTGDVLDAGCGHGEVSLALAAAGYAVVGLELSGTAVAWAQRSAVQRGLHNATFAQADITTFTGYDGRFSSVVDCTLFHALPIDARDAYLRAVHRATASGADFYTLAFAKGAYPAEMASKPNEVDAYELHAAVGRYFDIDFIRPAPILANVETLPGFPSLTLPFERDTLGRLQFPGYLLHARKAESTIA